LNRRDATRLQLVITNMNKQFNQRQPDKGGYMASAKSTISFPFANPSADESIEKPSNSESQNEKQKSSEEDAKGSVRPKFLTPSVALGRTDPMP
jgi:hypothetical protein